MHTNFLTHRALDVTKGSDVLYFRQFPLLSPSFFIVQLIIAITYKTPPTPLRCLHT